MPEEFENVALFLRLGLPSTLIRHENGAFRKQSSNQRNLKIQLYSTKNILKLELFENDDVTIITWLSRDFPDLKHKSKLTSDCCCVFKFLHHSVDGTLRVVGFSYASSGVGETNCSQGMWSENIWCVFRVKRLCSNSSGVVWKWAWMVKF